MTWKCKVAGCEHESSNEVERARHEQQDPHCCHCGEGRPEHMRLFHLMQFCEDCQVFHDAEMELGIYLEV